MFPKKLDLYIIKKFMFTFFIAILLIIGIVIIFDISEKVDDFVSSQAPIESIMFDYYLNFIPQNDVGIYLYRNRNRLIVIGLEPLCDSAVQCRTA